MNKGLILAVAVSCPAYAAAAEGDVEAVKAVVKSAYVEGYLSLYRFPDGWKIVSKIFQAHPPVTSR